MDHVDSGEVDGMEAYVEFDEWEEWRTGSEPTWWHLCGRVGRRIRVETDTGLSLVVGDRDDVDRNATDAHRRNMGGRLNLGPNSCLIVIARGERDGAKVSSPVRNSEDDRLRAWFFFHVPDDASDGCAGLRERREVTQVERN